MLEALCLLLGLQDPPPPQITDPQGDSQSITEPLHGSLWAKFRNRWTREESDADLYQYLSLSYGDSETDPVSAAASARLAQDLDGAQGFDGPYVFDSLDDTRHSRATTRLYTAYLDLQRPLPGLRLRGGRQTLDEIPESISMDGVAARFEAFRDLTLGAFGGRPVNLFESSPSGDRMYGGWVQGSLWKGNRAGLEYLHLEDENIFGLFDDDLVGLTFEQGLKPLHVRARHTILEGEARETVGRATASFPETGLILDGQVTYLHERQQALSYPLDPYAVFLLDLEPYVQSVVRASKSFGRHVGLDLSYTQREFVRDGSETVYNHEFVRWNVTPSLSGWPWAEGSIALAADYWRTTGDDFWTIGGDVSWKVLPEITLAAGSSYALYSIDALTGEERERVRSVSLSIRGRLSSRATLDARFTIEDNEIDRFRSLEVGVRHAF